jgi:hypothetical protein
VHRPVVSVLGVLVSACFLAGCGASGGIDSKAVAVTDTFTKLAFNEHNCPSASRYTSNPQFCASLRAGGMIPVWSRFPLTSHRIRRTGCGLGHLPGAPSIAGSGLHRIHG